MDSLKRRLKKVYDGWETDRYTDEEFDARKAKYEGRQKELDAELAHLKKDEDNIEEQVDLILELTQTLNFNWFSYDFAKKTAILKLMSKEIIFGKEGKDKPLIIWELPWNALFAVGTGSNMEGWHARRDSKSNL